MPYIIKSNENEYVESYSFSDKKVVATDKKEDAKRFLSKSNADFVAEKLGYTVEEY